MNLAHAAREPHYSLDGQPPTALIFNIMRFATQDGPGIRTTIFFKGCPLSCWWCHNPESQSFQPDRLYSEERCRHCLECAGVCPAHAITEVDGRIETSSACTRCGTCAEVCMAEARQIAGRTYTVDQLLAEIEKDLVFFDESGGGVTLSGGEPLSQPAFVSRFLAACRDRAIRTTLETCGFAQPDVFPKIALASSLVLFDLKFVDSASHRHFTGVPNDLILRNLESLVGLRHPHVVRIPVVPGVNDTAASIAAFAEYLARLAPAAVQLLPYHRTGIEKYRRLGLSYKLGETPQAAAADLTRLHHALWQAGVNVAPCP
jgi:pyruvate formate lyase activating enzyme